MSDKKWFELSPDKKIIEADWHHGSIFISSGPEGTQTTETYIVNRKSKHHYQLAINEKNARRKFHRRNLI